MPSLTLKCCCSATFEGSGENIWLEFRAKTWQEKHEKCPEIYRPVQKEPQQVIRLVCDHRKNYRERK